MQKFRQYGSSPYEVAILHGGPGAPGEVAPVAKELSKHVGIIEPFQNASSIEGQIEELKEIVHAQTTPPITLIGWSWGAMLGFIFSSKYPKLVKKLILLNSGVFDEKYVKQIMNTRRDRLSEDDKKKLKTLEHDLHDPKHGDKDKLFSEFGKLMSKADSYDTVSDECEIIEFQYEIYEKIWPEVVEFRKSGQLVASGRKIECPVTAIHGDYDPHPSEGINAPLSKVIKDFNFIELAHCGHYPWLEKQAKERFYSILSKEILNRA